MGYIDAEKLLAEIKIIQQSLESRDVRFNQVKKIRTECLKEFCKCIIEVITSLQQEQPEVDLDEYLDMELSHYGLSRTEISRVTLTASAVERIIRNAFELGVKAKQN